MRLLISTRGEHSSPDLFTHYMAVDQGKGMHGLLIDLSGLQHSVVNPDSFVDPSIVEVTWGLTAEPDGKGGLRAVEGGVITRRDGSQQQFFDKQLLVPYIAAWEVRCKELLRERA